MDKIFSQIKQRVLQYIDYKTITKDSFFKKTNISPSNFKGDGLKSELGGDKIAKILTEYVDINPEWLLTGKGKMLKEESAPVQPRPTIINKECELCKEKDKLIYSQQKNIKLLEDRVETLTVHLQSIFFTHFPTNCEKSQTELEEIKTEK